ncbi:MAG: insulinase family protein [Chitinophagales bacterium]
MKRIFPIVVVLLFAALTGCHRDGKTQLAAGSSGNPYPVKEYTLDNGLKVFISVNKTAPRIQTAITVKAGSKYDPAKTTGLAHYLEHMLFKGTKQFGTTDYSKEEPYLNAISDLFEKRMNEPDEAKKKELYHQIDSLSYLASKISIANEYDKMVGSLGAKGTNAFTDRDLTCYVNDIPSNALEKWLAVEGDRFQNLVLRIFHTELEAVYEEFNISTGVDQEWSYQAVDSMLMPNHPYGTQTTIGLSSHLKNPSMVNIHKYFDTYYVPNNCAIVLSGDLDPDKTIALIKKYFGSWKKKDVPAFVKAPPVPIAQPVSTEKFGQEPEHVFVGFRFDGANSKEYLYVKLIDAILSNGKGSGLIDLNLLLQQKTLAAASYLTDNKDYTVQKLYGEPKQGQSLQEVQQLLLAQLDSVKEGRFADWVIPAIIDNMRLEKMKQAETNEGRTFDMVFAFVKDEPLADHFRQIDEMSKITKADVMAFAKSHYTNNYATCYKKMGKPSLFKVEKPAITPVETNKDLASAFREKFDKMPMDHVTPHFMDFANDISHGKMQNGIPVDYIHNELNGTFRLSYIFDMGTDNNRKLKLATDYLDYLGTDKYTAAQLKEEFYKLGLTFEVECTRDEVKVNLAGLEKNLDKGIALVDHILSNVKADQQVYDNMVGDELKMRADAKLDKSVILQKALANYGKYGPKNPFNNVLSDDEIRNIKAEELVAYIHDLLAYKHSIFYYGQNDISAAVASLDKAHHVSSSLKDYPVAEDYPEKAIGEPVVYFANYPMKQAELMMLSWDEVYNKSMMPAVAMFNEYYGGNMSSVLFQEIREKQALAYSVYGQFGVPVRKDQHFALVAYVGTQADKLPTAVKEMSHLYDEMPMAEQQFNMSKESMIKNMENDWITRDDVYWAYRRAAKRGLDYDIRKDIFDQAGKMKITDVQSFFNQHVKGKKYVYLVLGSKEDVNLKALEALGPVKELSLKELFGY